MMADALYSIDVALFRFFNGTISNPLFDIVMPFLTDLNKQPVVLVLLAAALAWLTVSGGKTGRIAVGLLILTIIISDQLNSSVVKYLFERLRPCSALEGVHLLVNCGSGYSFPSSHAVNNLAGAVVLSHFYRKWTWAFMTFAGVVAFSRISVGVHYPSDVLAGAAFGAGIGFVVLFCYHQVEKWLAKRFAGKGTHDPAS